MKKGGKDNAKPKTKNQLETNQQNQTFNTLLFCQYLLQCVLNSKKINTTNKNLRNRSDHF